MLDSILSGKLHDAPPKSFAAISMPSRWKTYSKKKEGPARSPLSWCEARG